MFEQRRGPKKRSVKELEDRIGKSMFPHLEYRVLTKAASVEAVLSGGSLPSSVGTSSNASISTDSTPDVPSNSQTPPKHDFMPYSDSVDMLNFIVPTAFQSHPVESMIWPDMSNADSVISQPDHDFQTMLPEEIDKFPDLLEIQDL